MYLLHNVMDRCTSGFQGVPGPRLRIPRDGVWFLVGLSPTYPPTGDNWGDIRLVKNKEPVYGISLNFGYWTIHERPNGYTSKKEYILRVGF